MTCKKNKVCGFLYSRGSINKTSCEMLHIAGTLVYFLVVSRYAADGASW